MEKETNFDPKTLFFGLAWVIESDNFVFNYLDDLEIIRIEIILVFPERNRDFNSTLVK